MKSRSGSAAIFTTGILLGAAAVAPPAQAQLKIQRSEQRLLPTGDDVVHDLFGSAVAIDGKTMVIGAQGADGIGFDTGVAYIFERSGDGWVQTAKLFANDADIPQRRTDVPELPATIDDEFGTSVAISGDTVAIGSPGHRSRPDLPPSSGAVYVFQRVDGTWIQQAELSPPTPATDGTFGSPRTLGISGDIIAVGNSIGTSATAIPSVAIFTRTNGTWGLTATLTVPDDFSFSPDSVAVDRHTVVVGSTFSDAVGAFQAGAAYVFRFVEEGPMAGSWVQQARLTATDPSFGALFGFSVAVSGKVAAVGAVSGPGVTAQSGAAYAFTRDDGAWGKEAKLIARDGADGDFFGMSVALDDGTVLVGAQSHTTAVAPQAGSAYVYRRLNGDWSQLAEVSASDGIQGGTFGQTVAIQGATLLVGAAGQNANVEGYSGGEAYVYRLKEGDAPRASPTAMTGGEGN